VQFSSPFLYNDKSTSTTVNNLKKIYMKKNLLLMMLCIPAVLAAQDNGVIVSNLAVDAGTVTFNVSWESVGMPALWSDTVWVFVDYNDAGVMKRFPVTDATASAGTVTKVLNNDKGVWVAGNARDADSFSATVQLFTTVSNVAGACAYASNYPPVGEYSSDAPMISFTGTPMYEISLAKSGGGSVTVKSGDTLLLPCGYSLASFTDATGAPGITDESCTAPGRTVTFTEFDPCPTAVIGDYWYLTDTREPNNVQTYKVKLMADGHIWMVQDLKFGDKCNKDDFKGSNGSDQIGNLTSLTDKTYYGDCTNMRDNSTPISRGYLYDWAAAINKSSAYYGSSVNVGCSGTSSGTVSPNPSSCQGICPNGWHVPTGGTGSELYALCAALGCGNTYYCSCLLDAATFEGVLGGAYETSWAGNVVVYASSTYNASTLFYVSCYPSIGGTYCNDIYNWKDSMSSLRCVRNY
jgi:uncharacterized protein (TIGR02145 family)